MDKINIDKELIVDIAAKVALGSVPFAGTFLSEVYSYRSQVKQKRLNDFVNLILTFLENIGGLDKEAIDNLKSEEFGDILESIMRRVVQTRSKEKTERFARILIQAMKAPVDEDYSETFLDLIAGLSEKQIEILDAHDRFGYQFSLVEQIQDSRNLISKLELQVDKDHDLDRQGLANSWLSLKQELEIAKRDLEHKQTIRQGADKIRKAGYYGLKEGEYQFLVQDLYAKALFIDIGVGTLSTRPFEVMAISAFGQEFLAFIKDH